MTKYSKIKKSSFAILALSLILVAVLAFGGTYAYFSATATGSGDATMGSLKLAVKNGQTPLAADSLDIEGKVVPNQTILDGSAISIDLTGTDIEYYIRVTFTTVVTPLDEDAEHTAQCGEPANILDITGISGWEEYMDGETHTGVYYLATSGTATKSSATSQTFQPTVTINKKVGNKGCQFYMGAGIKVTMTVEAIQANYLTASSGDSATAAMTVEALHTAWAGYVTVA